MSKLSSNQLVKKYLPLLREEFDIYSAFNIKITNKDGDLIRLSLNRAQRKVWKKIKQCILEGKPIRMYVLKARQLGFTTLFSAILYWLCSLNKNRRYLFVSHDLESAHNICARLQSYYMHSHPVLQPEFRRMNREMIHFATKVSKISNGEDVKKDIGLDSMIFVRTADNPHLGKSFTFGGAHLTEFCSWPTLGIDVKSRMVSLAQAIPYRANTFVFIETTAQGENYGKEFWDDETNGYEKIFVSWCADDFYRIAKGKAALVNNRYEYTEIEGTVYFDLSNDPNGRYGDEFKEREHVLHELRYWYPVDEYEEKDCDFPDLEDEDYEVWLEKESMRRLLWRRQQIDGECQGDKWAFRQEYPTTIPDAWGVKTTSIFDAERLLEMDYFRKNHSPQPVRYRYHHDDRIPTSDEYTDELLEHKFEEQLYGHLWIYKPPQVGKVYVAGADGAQGVPKGDESGIVILELPTLEEVAMFSDIIKPTPFAGVCNYLCRLYNNALLGVERNDKGGFAALEYLVNMYKYPNLYFYIHPMKHALTGDPQWGFHTHGEPRSMAIRDAMENVDNMDVVVNSQKLLEQMNTFIKWPKIDEIKAAPGKKDDVVMAWIIAQQMAKQLHIKVDKPPKQTSNKLTHGYFRKLAEQQYKRDKNQEWRQQWKLY